MRLATLALTPAFLTGQCIQCSRSAGAQQASGIAALNLGIVVLLIPVVGLLAGFAWLTWRRREP